MAAMKFYCDAERCIECNGCVTVEFHSSHSELPPQALLIRHNEHFDSCIWVTES